jgi:hypothetical protein
MWFSKVRNGSCLDWVDSSISSSPFEAWMNSRQKVRVGKACEERVGHDGLLVLVIITSNGKKIGINRDDERE